VKNTQEKIFGRKVFEVSRTFEKSENSMIIVKNHHFSKALKDHTAKSPAYNMKIF
jgi:hypothetical protein